MLIFIKFTKAFKIYLLSNHKMELKINIYWGLSILLKYREAFEYLINNNICSKIIFSIDNKSFKILRGKQYKEDFFIKYYSFMDYINNNDKIVCEKHMDFPTVSIVELINKYNIPTNKILKLNYNLIKKKNSYNCKYITISVKTLNLQSIFYQRKKEIFECINNYALSNNYKIIIMGEKKITNCKEYTIHKAYNIYNDCMQYINCNIIIDNTYKNSLLNNNLNEFLDNTSIFHYSKLNIYFGDSGISEILHYCSENILGFTLKQDLMKCNINNINNCINIITFLNILKNKY